MDQEEKVYEAIFRRSKSMTLAAASAARLTNQSERKPLAAIREESSDESDDEEEAWGNTVVAFNETRQPGKPMVDLECLVHLEPSVA